MFFSEQFYGPTARTNVFYRKIVEAGGIILVDFLATDRQERRGFDGDREITEEEKIFCKI